MASPNFETMAESRAKIVESRAGFSWLRDFVSQIDPHGQFTAQQLTELREGLMRGCQLMVDAIDGVVSVVDKTIADIEAADTEGGRHRLPQSSN